MSNSPEASCVASSQESSNSLRRRELFPSTDEDSSDDLGNMSPLSSGSFENTNSASDNDLKSSFIKFRNSKLSDYEVLENICRSNLAHIEIVYEDALDKSDSFTESEDITTTFDDSVTSNETPSRSLPCLALKTPEDAVTTSATVPKLFRKSPFGDHNSSKVEPGKHKAVGLVSTSPQKLDHLSKVRTVLFPQSDLTIPVSAFYTKPENHHVQLALKLKASIAEKHKHKSSTSFSSSRKTNSKNRRTGEINAGVRHGIRKPRLKSRKIAVRNIMDGCTAPLIEYLNDLKELSGTSKQIQEFKKVDESQNISILSESNSINIVERKTDVAVSQSTKRKGSPLPDTNKKFFKYRRSHATITLDERVKFAVDEGKLTLFANKEFDDNKYFNEDTTGDLEMFENENLIAKKEVEDIIFNLSKDDDIELQSQLKPYSALPKREYSIDFNNIHKPNEKENKILAGGNSMLLSPTTQMCNMTSGLALNSPVKAVCNLNNILNKENINIATLNAGREKLYPVFYGPQNPPPKPAKISKLGSSKKFKALPKDQMLLDAGQKKFGATQCAECKFVYHMGDPNDELMHHNYHSAASVLRFCGWKGEQVVGRSENGRIIRIVPSDPKAWVKKVKDLLDVVNRDLGYYDMEMFLDNTQVYIYITHKTIVGCLVAEPKTLGHRMLSDNTGIDLCSEISYPIKCGVSRVWVTQAYRQRGIGRALLNCLRTNFLYGGVLTENDIAFSSPTIAGKAFATKYFNTPNFLVYFS